MKIYNKWENHTIRHPKDLKKIIEYLCAHGDLNVSAATVERLYSEFSESAGWMNVSDELLEQFADWLDEIDL